MEDLFVNATRTYLYITNFSFSDTDAGSINNVAGGPADVVRKAPVSGAKTYRNCATKERRDMMLETCQQPQEIDDSFRDITKQVLNNIFVDDAHEVMGCFVAKVACSTWKYIMINATGKVNNVKRGQIAIHSRPFMRTVGLHVLADYTPDEIEHRLRNYYKFMLVRHPFDRLSSAYREKFGPKNTYYHEALGKGIIKKYRKNATQESLETGNDVKFGEFVKYLLDGNPPGYNDHWKRYYEVCDPCRVKYNHIAKLETMGEDAGVILPTLGLSSHTSLPEWNVNLQAKKYDISSGKNLSYVFDGLPPEDVRQLLRIYDYDFRLFGYQWDNVTSAAKCQSTPRGETCC